MSKARFSLIGISAALFTLASVVPALAQGPKFLLSARRLVVGLSPCGVPGSPACGEIATTATVATGFAGGLLFDKETVTAPGECGVMLIELSATGDSHFGAQMDLGCSVTSSTGVVALCEPLAEAVPITPSGWVAVQRFFDPDPAAGFSGDGGGGPADWHDNNINQEWCVPLPEPPTDNTFVVKLKLGVNPSPFLASGPGTKVVFLDNVKVYIECASTQPRNPDGACSLKHFTFPIPDP